jgi:iron complex outermembrane recepter protein
MNNCPGRPILTTVAMAVLAIEGAHASETTAEEEASLAEVVVTAQKRSENLQSVPLSITVLDAGALQRLGATEFEHYAAHIPNLSFSQGSSTVFGGLYVAIRGVYGADTTGFYVDDTPVPESMNPHLTDIARIEVLRGPQGTLFGARSMGGAVRIITNQPDPSAWSGDVHATASATAHAAGNSTVDGVVNMPIVADIAALRLSAFREAESGMFDRVSGVQPALPPGTTAPPFAEHRHVDGSLREGVQLSGLVKLLDGQLTLKPRVAVQHDHLDGLPYADSDPNNFTQVRLFDLNEPAGEDWQHYSLTAEVPLASGEIVSSSALLRHSADMSEDYSEAAILLFGIPPTPALMRYHETLRRFAQETRFTSQFQGPVQVTAGIFYSSSLNNRLFPQDSIAGLDAFFGGALGSDVVFNYHTATEVNEKAVFGEMTVSLTSRLKAILGARWFKNTVDFNGAESGAAVSPGQFSGTEVDRKLTPKASLQYEVEPGKQVYATAAQGFRIGGVNTFSNTLCAADLAAANLTPQQAQSYKSDSLWSYELGTKTGWLENRLSVNAAVFDIEWSDVQQAVALPTCGFSIDVNAGKARSQGAELELEAAPAAGLTVTLGLGYTDTQITSNGGVPSIRVGQPLQQIPRWTASVAADYNFHFLSRRAFVHGDFGYTGSSLSANNDTVDPLLRRSYALVNLRSGMTFGSTEVGVFVSNLFDKHANFSDTPPLAVELPDRPRILTNRPRTMGVEARVLF